jgi:hypothetical protein
MSRPLDFIIFGVARSGTKALVRALNLHPHVYCAMERFHFRTDHSRITFPQSFLDTSEIRDPIDLKKNERMSEELAKKEDVRHAGNKLPRYYFALERINQEVPALKNIWIYRSPYGFMPSWNRRELENQRGQWPAGQVGLFGLLELLVCIGSCLRLRKDVFIFPYEHGLSDSPAVTLQALEFLGADPSLYDGKTFEQRQRRRRKTQLLRKGSGSRRSDLKVYEEELLDALQVQTLDSILRLDRGVMLSELAAPLGDYLDRIVGVLPRALDRAFSACDSRAARSFGREHFRRNRAEFKDLLKRADGSKVLAGFHRFGVYDRLRALYVQRSALRRRLSSIRCRLATLEHRVQKSVSSLKTKGRSVFLARHIKRSGTLKLASVPRKQMDHPDLIGHDWTSGKSRFATAPDPDRALRKFFADLGGGVDHAHQATSPERRNLPLILISQLPRSGGSLLSQLCDGHKQLQVHPSEMRIGFPSKDTWPGFDPCDSPDRLFAMLFQMQLARLAAAGYSKKGKGKSMQKRLSFEYSPSEHYRAFVELLTVAPGARAESNSSLIRWTAGRADLL